MRITFQFQNFYILIFYCSNTIDKSYCHVSHRYGFNSLFAIISSIEFYISTKYDKYDDVRQFKLDQDASWGSDKSLGSRKKEAASIHLNAAHQALSSLSVQAKEQFEAGMKALSTGDSNGASMHLKAAEMKLLAESWHLKFASKFFVVVKE